MGVLDFLYTWEFWITALTYGFCAMAMALTMYFFIIYNHLGEFPTSPHWPVFGHVFDYVNPYKSLTTLTNNTIKYGGVLRQYIGPRKPSLLVADKDFLEFLCNNSKYVGKAQFYQYMKPWLGEGLITSDGDKWMLRRKALTLSFTQTSQLLSFLEVFEQKSDILLSILDTYHNKEVNLHPIMKRFTLDVICETAMGVSLNSQENPDDSKYARNVEILCEVAQSRMTSFLKNFDFFFQFTDDCIREKKALAVVENMLETIISQKLEKQYKSEEKTKKDMLDLLMEMEINGKSLTRSDLREEINTFTFAGYDTTSSAMALTLYEIAAHPEIQKKLLEEQKTIFKVDLNTPTITIATLQEMTYLDMVIRETLRLHTIVPAVGKRVTKDLKYGDKRVPAMLNFSIFIYGFHHNPAYFPEPDKFIPERFTEKLKDYTYLPFGVKPRQCLGKNFAMLEMKCVISKIIRHFEVVRIPDHKLKLLPKLVLFSSSGIWVKLRKRSKNVPVKEIAEVIPESQYILE